MMTIGQALERAVQHHQAGQLPQAEQLYRAILQVDGQQVDALHLLGVIAYQVGQHEQALEYMGQAVRLQPDYAEAHNNLGNVFQEQGQLDEAVTSYQQALRLKPDYADAHNNLGNVLHKQGKLAEALASLQQALRLRPADAEVHNNLGNVLQAQGKLAEAVASYGQALCLQPDYVEAHNNLGNVLKAQGQLEEAVASLQQALRRKPDCAGAHNNLGSVFQAQGKLEEAVASYQQALCFQPDYAEAHKNRALAWLLAGDFEQGWPEYEWRWQCQGSALPRFPQPLWDGTPLAGKTILLHAEQGLGDTLQFIRYAPLVQERGGQVLVVCPPALVPLLSSCRGIDRLIPEGSPLPPFDVYAMLLSVPGLLGTTLANVPAEVPYLAADSQRCHFWRERLRGCAALQIGINWQGNPSYRDDRHRSIPLAHFAPLAQLPGVELVSLQKGYGTEQLRTVADRFPVTDLGRQLDDTAGAFVDTAAVLTNLDLVITSDTALPHLAGALGVPVWVALPYAPDWRWLLQREDSPWYPTMRLFRQREWGNWAVVFQRLAAAVQQWRSQRGAGGGGSGR